MTGVTLSGPTDPFVTYQYDALGRRSRKNLNGDVTEYLYDGNQVLMEFDGEGTLLRRYVYGPGIDEPILMQADDSVYYFHFDAQGSVVALTDESGTEAEVYSYGPFGEGGFSSALGNPYGYTGRRFDAETGLYFNRARYYNPTLGRFMQTDPIGYSGGLNLYAYAMNNPLMLVDPFGLCAEGGGVGEYFGRSLNQVILGNYTDDVTLLGTAGQLVLSASGLDVLADARDLWYDVTHWENSWSHAFQTAGDFAALLPIVGMAKYGDEAGALAKNITGNSVQANRKLGNDFRDEIAELMEKEGFEVRKEVFKDTPFGARYIDLEIRKNGEVLGAAL